MTYNSNASEPDGIVVIRWNYEVIRVTDMEEGTLLILNIHFKIYVHYSLRFLINGALSKDAVPLNEF